MATESDVQSIVHNLEEGKWKKWVTLAVIVAIAAFVSGLFLFDATTWSWAQFRGLSHSKAMDQAQVAREIARGNGFSTKFIRPLAITQLLKNKGTIPADHFPDTYNAPLNPWINSLFLRLTKSSWQMSVKDFLYPSDRLIAAVALLFFFLSVGVNFLTASRLFDARLASFGCCAVLLSEPFWQYAVAGLPQMLMLLLFSGALYFLVRALQARDEEKSPTLWLALASGMFGLLALAHGLTIWIFIGALAFSAIVFRPILKNVLVMLLVFAALYGPWMARNYSVCGSVGGVAYYSVFYQLRGTESEVMRSTENSFSGLTPISFRNKIQNQVVEQLAAIYQNLGFSFLALTFFITLLHLYKRPVIATFRWGVLLMFLFALLGMAIFGSSDEEPLKSNNLVILFVPVMTFYGMAYVLFLWSQWEVNIRLFNIVAAVLLYTLLGLPLAKDLLVRTQARVQWPPYIPPYIAYLNTLTYDNEIIASDMPWGVAWYADRKSLWLPSTVNDFIAFNDYNRLGNSLVGLYLTPVSGNKPFISGIVKGEYKEWAPFILRNVSSKDFPLRAVTGLPIDNECVFYSDRDRWSGKPE